MQVFSKFLVNIAQNGILRRLKNLITNTKQAKLYAKQANNLFEEERKFIPTSSNILLDKIALVTGGTSPIGVMCVKELLRNGVKATMIADSNVKYGEEVLKQICQEYGSQKAAFIKTDLSRVKLLRNAFYSTKNHFKQLDIVINIAKEIEYAPWNEQIEKNLKGLIRGTLLGYEYLGLQNGGSGGFILNVLTTRSLDDTKTNPIAVGTKYYLTNFGKAISDKYQNTTGVKVISALYDLNQDSFYEEGLNYEYIERALKGKTLPEMLKLSKSGSVWMFQCLEMPQEEQEERRP